MQHQLKPKWQSSILIIVIVVFFLQGNLSVNRKELQTLIFKGPTRENPVLDPLAVQQTNMDNQNLLISNCQVFKAATKAI